MFYTKPEGREVQQMFNSIASAYDRINRVISGSLDQYWRKEVARLLPPALLSLPLLDCATGTGRQIEALFEIHPSLKEVIGIDFSEKMLAIAQASIEKKPYHQRVKFIHADMLCLPFDDQSFGSITVSFGIRNVENVEQALKELYRVLKPAGMLLILEGTPPPNALLNKGFKLYCRHVMTPLAGWLSGQKKAYAHLQQSMEIFPSANHFLDFLDEAGFHNTKSYQITKGIAHIYEGSKPA